MIQKAHKVCVVTVTYGNRMKFLSQLINYVQSNNLITNIIITDNASVPAVSDWISEDIGSKAIVLKQKENKGSAFGYKAALQYATENTEADFFWFLDDDNLPTDETLNNLLKSWELLSGKMNLNALSCLRADRKAHQEILCGANPADYYLVPNNFMGFHIWRIVKNQLRKLRKINIDKAASYVKMPYVPYGGFFIHRKGVAQIGYPDERFFLYVDDSEYTYRISKAGGSIFLISNAIVNDVDTSQGINYTSSFLKSKILDLWNFRTYYQVRNRIYFYSLETIENKWIFWLNKKLYLLALCTKSVINGQRSEFRKFKKAVEDGLNKKLGLGNPKYF